MSLGKPLNKVTDSVLPDTGYTDNTVLGEGLLMAISAFHSLMCMMAQVYGGKISMGQQDSEQHQLLQEILVHTCALRMGSSGSCTHGDAQTILPKRWSAIAYLSQGIQIHGRN